MGDRKGPLRWAFRACSWQLLPTWIFKWISAGGSSGRQLLRSISGSRQRVQFAGFAGFSFRGVPGSSETTAFNT